MQLKRLVTAFGVNVTSSRAVEKPLLGPTVRIPNFVRPVFYNRNLGEDWCDRDGLLFVGRLVSMKGADAAIETLRILKEKGVDTHLTICGDGPERGKLERQARRCGLQDNVFFEGWMEPTKLARLYSSSQVFLFPTRNEGFGIVALEAIACGCPVVASNVGGVPDAVGDCGILLAPDNGGGYAEAIEAVLERGAWRELRSAMPGHIERHRLQRIAGEYLKVIKEAANEA